MCNSTCCPGHQKEYCRPGEECCHDRCCPSGYQCCGESGGRGKCCPAPVLRDRPHPSVLRELPVLRSDRLLIEGGPSSSRWSAAATMSQRRGYGRCFDNLTRRLLQPASPAHRREGQRGRPPRRRRVARACRGPGLHRRSAAIDLRQQPREMRPRLRLLRLRQWHLSLPPPPGTCSDGTGIVPDHATAEDHVPAQRRRRQQAAPTTTLAPTTSPPATTTFGANHNHHRAVHDDGCATDDTTTSPTRTDDIDRRPPQPTTTTTTSAAPTTTTTPTPTTTTTVPPDDGLACTDLTV